MSALTNLKTAAEQAGIKAFVTNSETSLETQLRRLTKEEDLPIMLVSWDSEVRVEFDTNGFLKNPSIAVTVLLLTKPEDLNKDTAESAAQEMGEVYKSFLQKLFTLQSPIAKDPAVVITNATYKLVPWHSISKHSGCLGKFSVIDSVVNCTQPSTPRYYLETSATEGGKIFPVSGFYNEGEVVTVVAAPDPGYEFIETKVNEGEVDEVIQLNPWFTQEMTGNKVIRAFFQTLIDIWYQQVFTDAENEIESDGSGGWEFANSGTGDVPLGIKDTQVLTLDGASHVDSGVKQIGGQPINIRLIGYLETTDGSQSMISCGGYSTTTKGIGIRSVGSALQVISSDGTSLSMIPTHTMSIGAYDITFIWSGLLGDDAVVTYNGSSVNASGLLSWAGDSPLNWLIGTYQGTVGKLKGLLFNVKVDNKFDYYFQDSNGVVINDQLGLNNGTLIGANQAVAWGTKSDAAYPALLRYGGEVYESDTVAGQYIYVIANSDGTLKAPTISGYTKIEEHTPNKTWNTGNTYLQPQDVGLVALSEHYGLDWTDGSGTMIKVDWATLYSYKDLVGVDTEDFRITIDETTREIKDMDSQPYEKLYDTETGEMITDTESGEIITGIKNF